MNVLPSLTNYWYVLNTFSNECHKLAELFSSFSDDDGYGAYKSVTVLFWC